MTLTSRLRRSVALMSVVALGGCSSTTGPDEDERLQPAFSQECPWNPSLQVYQCDDLIVEGEGGSDAGEPHPDNDNGTDPPDNPPGSSGGGGDDGDDDLDGDGNSSTNFHLEWDVVDEEEPPDCSDPTLWTSPGQEAFCIGQVPSGIRLNHFNAAINAIELRGGVCADMAAAARDLLAAGNLREYWYPMHLPNNPNYPPTLQNQAWQGGYAALGGDWVVLHRGWLDWFRTTPAANGGNFQHALAHEMDHHLGTSGHQKEGWTTMNSESCGGVTITP